MKFTNKKAYMIPETEFLSLESVHTLMASGGPSTPPTPGNDVNVDEFGAPGRKAVF